MDKLLDGDRSKVYLVDDSEGNYWIHIQVIRKATPCKLEKELVKVGFIAWVFYQKARYEYLNSR